jgi:16S rRNA (cytidine1402-2'-O)-methyltransferase
MSPVQIAFFGHPELRADDVRTLEVLDADEWSQRGAAIGFRASYDPQALLALRGRVTVQIEVGALQDRFEATMAATFHRGLPLVFRRDTLTRAKPLAWQSSKAAADLDRELIAALREPGASGTLTIAALDAAEIPAGTLVLVGMPIGNQADLSPRATDVLASVDAIFAEDTRVTEEQLRWRGVKTPVVSCHEHNEHSRIPQVVARLKAGQRIALVSDAGTPLMSDPGYLIVQAAKQAGAHIQAVPGPSAIILALILSGLPVSSFRFEGFVPRKSAERERFIADVMQARETVVIFESVHRIAALLQNCAQLAPQREVAVCKDLTKRTETIFRGPVSEIAPQFSAEAEPRGEYTIVIAARAAAQPTSSSELESSLDSFVKALLQAGCPTAPIVRALRDTHGLSRDQAYEWVQSRKPPEL